MEEHQPELKEQWKHLKEESIKEYNKYLPYMKKYGFILLLIIPLALNIFLRTQPAFIPVTDIWAQNSIYDSIKNDVSNQINQQYPNLPQQNKEAIINQQINEFLVNNRDVVNQNIRSLSEQFKSQLRDENGYNYLTGLDPYFWNRHARNVINNGHPGDEIKDGVPFDNHMLAPLGRPVPPDMFHAYFTAYVFKVAHLFNKNITLDGVAFHTPTILIGLAVIAAFFLGRILGGNIAGFFASSVIAIHQSILIRTIGGFADTDSYQIFFPLVILLVLFFALNAQSTLKRILFSSLTGLLIGFYSFAWGGWWYIGLYIGTGVFIYLFFSFFNSMRKKEIKGLFRDTDFSKIFYASIIILFSSLLFLSVFSGPRIITQIPSQVFGFVAIHEVSSTYIWPNVYITVAEQNEGTIRQAIDQTGGIALYAFALIGLILYPLLRTNSNNSYKKASVIILIIITLIWILTTTWAVTRGIRFTLMLVPAFALAFGVAISFIPLVVKKLFEFLSIYRARSAVFIQLAAAIFGLIIIGLYPFADSGMWATSKSISFQRGSDMNDAWWNALEKIKKNSSEDAIITSWWDFGHWFKYIADRRVTFDGTSQNNPQAHWVGKILAADDERYAIGILRMLDCGANTGFEKLDFHFNDIARTRDLIDPMFTMSRQEAYEYLKYLSQSDVYLGGSIGKEEANEILNYTHCEPPESYFVASSDMVGKSGVWGHFGLWDFNKSMIYQELISQKYKGNFEASIKFLQTRFGMDRDSAEKTYYEVLSFDSPTANNWISPWPGYVNANNPCSLEKNGTSLFCQNNNVRINMEEGNYGATFEGRTLPYSLVYPIENGTNELILNPDAPYSIVAYNIGEQKYYLTADKNIANGMFTRMFFMNGYGLKYFQSVSHDRSFDGMDIYIYKINWNRLLEEE